MKPLRARVELVDPITEETFAVREGFEVALARLDGATRAVVGDAHPLRRDAETGTFVLEAPDLRPTRHHHLLVRFDRLDFDKRAGRLLAPEEAAEAEGPLWHPARFPAWDSGSGRRRNPLFGLGGRRRRAARGEVVVLRVPLRRLFVVGHRGAPHAYPENTEAALRAALEAGANALEIDLCLLADGAIAVFHDPKPVKQPPRIDRTLFEDLPHELISPTFALDGRWVTYRGVEDGAVVERGRERLARRDGLDLVRIDLARTREAYRYAPVAGEEHRLIDLEALLDLAAAERRRLHLLFLDVKPPGRLGDPRRLRDLGRRLGEALARRPGLPERVVVAYADAKGLARLREGIEAAGERRCAFAFDAAGGFVPWIVGTTRGWAWLPSFLRRLLGWLLPGVPDPLRVARRLDNTVVSVGTLARPAHLREIERAVRDRDHRRRSPVELVVHWTLNDEAAWRRSFEHGVNAILTDHPGRLAAWLGAQGVTLGRGDRRPAEDAAP